MLITIKTLEQKTFKIEIDETEKVLALKQKIEKERGVDRFPVSGQKLIYSGKILDDDKLISDCNIDPVKNFVVVMVVKQKAKASEKTKETETSTSQSGASSETASSSDRDASESVSAASESESILSASATLSTPSATPAPVVAQNTTELAESTLLTGSALESSITVLMSLGFSREQVMRALNRSFHNADRAAEYLLSGNIPDLPDDAEDISSTPPVTDSPASNVSTSDLSFLRNLPQFQLMRNQVQANPESLPQLLQQIGRSNPELLTVISQHQEAFIALLNETNPTEGGDSGAQGGGDGGGSLQIQVTPGEKEAIDRIVSMGFAEGEAIQAFFACDKNEQLAIEFLLSN